MVVDEADRICSIDHVIGRIEALFVRLVETQELLYLRVLRIRHPDIGLVIQIVGPMASRCRIALDFLRQGLIDSGCHRWVRCGYTSDGVAV